MQDVIQADLANFPTEDPARAAARAKQEQADAKARKEEEKASAARVKKGMAIQVQSDKYTIPDAAKAQTEREVKLLKIRLYFTKLGHKIPIKEPKAMPRTDAEIDELLLMIETHLQSHGGIEMAGTMYQSSFAAVEMLTLQFNPLNLHLSGPAVSLSATVAQNREKWDELLTEFAIAHAEWFMMGPGKRLIGFSIQMIQTVDQANKKAIVAHLQRQVPVPKEKEEANEHL